MKRIGFKQTESALFNLDSMRTKLQNERDDAFEIRDWETHDKAEERIEEIENLISKIREGQMKISDWNRIQAIVNERQMQRYMTCVAAGMDERIAAGAFED